MNNIEFVNKCKWLVNEVPNYYYSGTDWLNYDKTNGKFKMDCVLAIKGILWGFSANKNRSRGGAIYKSNGVADFTCNGALDYCDDVSTNFNNLVVGEYLCMKDTAYNHSGIYIGDGKVFECTTGWNTRKCIISNIDKNGNRSLNGVPNLKWTYHGKLKYIDYSSSSLTPQPRKLVAELQEVLNKQYGCGLAVDNSFGPLTSKACMNNYLYYLKKAPIHIKWLQTRLTELGYSVGRYGVDGSFGNDTLRAVKQFQKDRGLVVDGFCGGNTHCELTK